MTAIHGHWQEGRVILDQPARWAEGSRLVVCDLDEAGSSTNHDEIVGMTEQEQGDDPESIARWLAEFDSIPPLEMSADEEAAMWAWQKQVGDHTTDAMREQWLLLSELDKLNAESNHTTHAVRKQSFRGEP